MNINREKREERRREKAGMKMKIRRLNIFSSMV